MWHISPHKRLNAILIICLNIGYGGNLGHVSCSVSRWNDRLLILLEAAGPLTILLAQAVILGQPFLSDPLKRERWAALAEMLENPAEAKAFASFLKEEQTS